MAAARSPVNAPPASANGPEWPGQRLGLPDSGPRSVARMGRRLVALAIDWSLSLLLSAAFFAYDRGATLAIFAATQILFIATAGGSVGHLLLGMRVVPLTGGWIGVWRPIARTLLICIVIPAVIWDRDQRGLHDRLVGTVLVRHGRWEREG
ncbi:MAG: RDD family protein [Lacisediminihabitans sp.]